MAIGNGKKSQQTSLPFGVFVLILSGFTLICAYILQLMHNVQSEPYMDEIFHVNQTKMYCEGKYSFWNSKITTLPGLYITTVGILKFISTTFSKNIEELCMVINLRLVNIGLLMLLVVVINGVLKSLRALENRQADDDASVKSYCPWKSLCTALTIAQFPVLFFSSFLFYTDTGSTLTVLLCYWSALHGNDYTSCLFGILAVVFRQTNIIWVGFAAAIRLLIVSQWHRKRVGYTTLLNEIIEFLFYCIGNIARVIGIAIPYVTVFIGFLAFVYLNNGIVVGDRSSHQAVFNIPQLFYLASFVAIFSFPYLLTRKNVKFLYDSFTNIKGIALFLFLCILFSVIIRYFTYVHLYLISDNRHYTFYIWMRLFERHWIIRYILTPGYIVCFILILSTLNQNQCYLLTTFFVVCCAIVTIPQKLLEFRYFIIPYLMFRLHIKESLWYQIVMEFLMYTIINFVTIYLYIYRPFSWPDDGSPQRFMW